MFCRQLLLRVEKLMSATFAHSGKHILTFQASEEYGVLCYFEDMYALTHTIKVRHFPVLENMSPVLDVCCLCTRSF